jgi:hypothetical protein
MWESSLYQRFKYGEAEGAGKRSIEVELRVAKAVCLAILPLIIETESAFTRILKERLIRSQGAT